MSAGRFEIRIYEADSGEFHYIRQQPETATLDVNNADGSGSVQNTVLSDPATSVFWAKESRGAREYGLRPRKLRMQWLPGQAPEGYKEEENFDVTIYSTATYNNATLRAQGTYLGGTCKVVGKIPESVYPVS